MKKLFLLVFCTALFANEKIDLKWLNDKPRSIAKDFYIWQYLKSDIKPKEALKAIEQVRYLNPKVFHAFAKRYNDSSFKEFSSCLRQRNKTLINKPDYCIEAGLSIYDATKLSSNNLSKVIDKVKNNYPDFTKKLQIISSPIPFKSIELSDKDTFFGVFNQCGGVYRVKHFNQFFPKTLIDKLKDDKKFAQTIKLIVTNPKMKKAQKSLLKLSSEGLDYRSIFHLAINAVKAKEEKLALKYLSAAQKKAYYQMQKDNITFWQYLLTKDEKYLKTLQNSWDVNIYSLYANNLKQKLHDNIIYNLKQKKGSNSFDTSTPFSWIKVLSDSKKMNDEKNNKYESIFTDKNTVGHLAFVKERYHRYRKSYFITPYNKYIGKLDKNRQALIYAIARQESRFIQTSISHAYAMGTMQIMPFLSKAIAKELKEPYNIYDQLSPKTNLRYADHHLNFLERRLKHPLLIAYGYNGGIGFTNRMLKNGLFKKGRYEPYLSMELLPYDETKKYGKKVLANYFIYQNHLNKKDPVKLNKLLDMGDLKLKH